MKCGVIIDRYWIIVNVLCCYYNINEADLSKFLAKRENKYIYLLLMKEFKCFYKEKMKSDLNLTNDKSINYNLKRAEEKLLINKDFRTNFFDIGEKIQKSF